MNLREQYPELYQGKRENQVTSGYLYKVDKIDGMNKIQVLINMGDYSFTTECGSGKDLISGNKFSGSCYMEPFAVKYIKM